MKNFKYVQLINGRRVFGEMLAENKEEVEGALAKEGGEILNVYLEDGEKEISTDKKEGFLKRLTTSKMKPIDKILFFQNIGTMLSAGLPLIESVDLMKDDVKDGEMKDILFEIRYDLERGNTISSSLEKYPHIFKQADIAMVKAGEAAGSLDESFDNLYHDLKNEYDLVKGVKSAMTYPIVIIVVMVVISAVLMIFVLPQLAVLFEQLDVDVPASTQFLFTVGDLMGKYWYIMIAGIIIFPRLLKFIFQKFPKVKKGYQLSLFKIPFFGPYIKSYYVIRFTRMLGLLLQSGVPILKALGIVQEAMVNIPYTEAAKEIKKSVQSGDKLSEAIAKYDNLFPKFVNRMVTVGDRTGVVADSLLKASAYYREQLDEVLGNLTTIIEPVIMVVMGAGVGFIAISIITPIYDITNSAATV